MRPCAGVEQHADDARSMRARAQCGGIAALQRARQRRRAIDALRLEVPPAL
jgi:hypothetical protein